LFCTSRGMNVFSRRGASGKGRPVINPVESELTRLPEPEPPAALVKTVMARVSRLDEERPPASLASPAPMGSSREGRVGGWKDVPACVAALAGLALVVVSWIDGRLEADSWVDLVSLQVNAPTLVRMPPDGSTLLGLALGLLLYVVGLFAPLRSRQ